MIVASETQFTAILNSASISSCTRSLANRLDAVTAVIGRMPLVNYAIAPIGHMNVRKAALRRFWPRGGVECGLAKGNYGWRKKDNLSESDQTLLAVLEQRHDHPLLSDLDALSTN